MSLYSCLDQLELWEKNLKEKMSKTFPSYDLYQEQKTIYLLKKDIKHLVYLFENKEKENYKNKLNYLSELLTIHVYFRYGKHFDYIFNEIRIIINIRNNKEKDKIRNEEFLIAKIDQSLIPELGSSEGECYGFTLLMAIPAFNPFKNDIKKILFNNHVYNFQKNQPERKLDQQLIKTKSLTHRIFCPDYELQARNIYTLASLNKDKDLQVIRTSLYESHSVYISVRSNGEIWYMEPNYGAYRFYDEDSFVKKFALLSLKDKPLVDYFFYQLAEMRYDPHNKLEESIRWREEFISLLTGSKYPSPINKVSSLVTSVFIALSSNKLADLLDASGRARLLLILGGFYIGVFGSLMVQQRTTCRGVLTLPHFLLSIAHVTSEKMTLSMLCLFDNISKKLIAAEIPSLNPISNSYPRRGFFSSSKNAHQDPSVLSRSLENNENLTLNLV